MGQRLNWAKTIKIIGGKHCDVGFDSFLEITPKLRNEKIRKKKKTDKLDLVKMKSFFPSKRHFNRTKRQYTEWKKIFANHISSKELISRIFYEIQ